MNLIGSIKNVKVHESCITHYSIHSKTHLDEDKVKRDEAKNIYVKLCKKKSNSHEERLTISLLVSKFGYTRNYRKQIKSPQIDNTECLSRTV